MLNKAFPQSRILINEKNMSFDRIHFLYYNSIALSNCSLFRNQFVEAELPLRGCLCRSMNSMSLCVVCHRVFMHVYFTFYWPNPTQTQRTCLTHSAQEVSSQESTPLKTPGIILVCVCVCACVCVCV